MLERRSALHTVPRDETVLGAHRRTDLALGEIRGWSLTQVAGFPSTIGEVEARLRDLLRAEPPARASSPVVAGEFTVMRTGHCQFWVIGPQATDIADRARAVIAGDIGAVTLLSHARTRLFIEGAPAADVLKKGIALDFHDDVFPLGALAMTGVHHMPVMVHRTGASRYEIYAMRTFAVAVWEWLTDAALEFGYQVGTPS